MLKFTPKITNTRVIQYQDIIFAKWKFLAQILLLTLYSPCCFLAILFPIIFLAPWAKPTQASKSPRFSEPLSMVLTLFWLCHSRWVPCSQRAEPTHSARAASSAVFPPGECWDKQPAVSGDTQMWLSSAGQAALPHFPESSNGETPPALPSACRDSLCSPGLGVTATSGGGSCSHCLTWARDCAWGRCHTPAQLWAMHFCFTPWLGTARGTQGSPFWPSQGTQCWPHTALTAQLCPKPLVCN